MNEWLNEGWMDVKMNAREDGVVGKDEYKNEYKDEWMNAWMEELT